MIEQNNKKNQESFDDTIAMLNVKNRKLTSKSADETDLDMSQIEESLERPVSIGDCCG